MPAGTPASHNVGRIPTPGIPTPTVRKSPSSQPAVKPAMPKPKKSAASGPPADITKVKGFQFGGGTV